jgi:hypothetical protein
MTIQTLWRREENVSEHRIYDVPRDWAEKANLDNSRNQAMYDASIADPEASGGTLRQSV